MTIMELGKVFRKHFGFNPPIDLIMTYVKGPTNARIDIIKLDDEFARRDREYDNVECTYKGQNEISVSKYIELKYGTEAHEFITNNI